MYNSAHKKVSSFVDEHGASQKEIESLRQQLAQKDKTIHALNEANLELIAKNEELERAAIKEPNPERSVATSAQSAKTRPAKKEKNK